MLQKVFKVPACDEHTFEHGTLLKPTHPQECQGCFKRHLQCSKFSEGVHSAVGFLCTH